MYTELNLWGDIGGYIGLLLGYSMLNIAFFVADIINYRITSLEKEVDQIQKIPFITHKSLQSHACFCLSLVNFYVLYMVCPIVSEFTEC